MTVFDMADLVNVSLVNGCLFNISDCRESAYSMDWHMFSMFVYIMLIIVILIGNILVISAFFKDAALRAITNYWIVSLSMTDIILACTVLPLQTVREGRNGRWMFGQTVCDLFIFSDVLCCTCSIYHLALISLDRYFCVRFPIRYKAERTEKRTLLGIGLTWIWCMVISLPRMIGWKTEGYPDECTINNRSYLIFSSLVSFYIPLAFIIFMYMGVYKLTRKRSRRWDHQLAHSIRMREYFIHSAPITLQDNVNIPSVALSVAASTSTHSSAEQQGEKLNVSRRVKFDQGDTIVKLPDNEYADVSRRSQHESITTDRRTIISRRSKLNIFLRSKLVGNMRNALQNSSTSSVPSPARTGGTTVEVILTSAEKMEGEAYGTKDNRPKKSGKLGSPLRRSSSSNIFLQVPFTPDTLQRKKHPPSRSLSSSKLKKRKQKQEHKAAKVVMIVLGAFVVFWSPFFILNLLDPICGASCNITAGVFRWVTWLGYVNSAVNPFIYTFFNRTFRNAIISVITCKKIRRSGMTSKMNLY